MLLSCIFSMPTNSMAGYPKKKSLAIQASTFLGEEREILSMIKNLILEDPYITEDLRGMLLSDDPDPIFLQGELRYGVRGLWYKREGAKVLGPVNCTEFIICFGKEEQGWAIYSAYPVPENYYPTLITNLD